MKVYIESTIYHEPDELIERYPDLNEFGYGVAHITKLCKFSREIVLDENGNQMSAYCERVIDKPYITVESLEDMVELRRAVQNPLIFDRDEDGNYTIEIYDGYRE